MNVRLLLCGLIVGLAVVLAMSGCAAPPAPVPLSEPIVFEDVTNEVGLAKAGAAMCAWADYDNDGDYDVVIGGTLYRNEAGKRFVPVETGLRGPGVWGDYDNDGWIDFYALSGLGALHRNNGDGTFSTVVVPANEHRRSRSAAWVDIDNDAQLDLYITNYEVWHPKKQVTQPFPDLLLRSNGNGTFEHVWTSPEGQTWSSRGISAADFDNDGDSDLYVSNYRLMPNQLWINNGIGWFYDEAELRGAHGNNDGGNIGKTEYAPRYPVMGHTIGSCWGDLNNDGHLDLVVVNFSHPRRGQDHPMVLINSGPPQYTFTDINADDAAGIVWQESYAKGALGDYDNDGDLDLYMTTVYGGDLGELYENDGTGRFVPVADVLGVQMQRSYQVAWVDYDNDGDLDLLAGGRLFRNNSDHRAWLKVRVIGGAGSNHTGVGARVRVTAGKLVQIREVQAGDSGNQGPAELHFGLGDHHEMVQVEVFYPSGKYHRWQVKPRTTLVAQEMRNMAVKPRQ